MLKNYPILFFINKDNSDFNKYSYTINNVSSLLTKYEFNKNSYFMFFYSDSYLLDSNFLIDCKLNNKKILKFLELTKKNFLFIYYNNKFYNFNLLVKFIKLFSLNFSNFFYFFNLKYKNNKILHILSYLKKKKCLV